MNRQYLLKWMDDLSVLNAETLNYLEQIIRDYPYFQTARLLYTLNLKILNDYRYGTALRICSVYAPDRSRLKQLVQSADRIQKEVLSGMQGKDGSSSTPFSSDEELRIKELESQIKENLAQIEQKQKQLQKLLMEKRALLEGMPSVQPVEDDIPGDYGYRPLPKDTMLDDFLQETLAQGRSKPGFYSPEEAARRSLEENEGIISETLARLVAAQGRKDKAIKIYQQLMLQNPQKSSYFAAQIEKLNNQP